MKQNSLLAIYRFTVLEVLRTRLGLLALLIVLSTAAIAYFSASLAITESTDYRLITFATIIRLLAVFIVGLFVASSVIREFEQGVFDLVVSRAVSRASWYVSKLLAYLIVVIVFSIICVIPLGIFGANQLFNWWFGFVTELIIVASAAMAFAITLKNTTIAVTAVLSFYVLSRIISALVLMSSRAASEIAQPVNKLIANFVQSIAYLLPDLSRFANSSLLLHIDGSKPAQELLANEQLFYIGAQGLIYCVLLFAVGLFDLYRRNS
ncbi:MAG: hypothetical protein ACU84Q_00030 [Gammaproteobacteria bacterium]